MARILIIDDDDAFRATRAETIEALGHQALQCASAEDGLRRLRRGDCDAALLDQRMPGMSGLEALSALAALRQRDAAVPPVAMLTAYAGGANTIEAMKLGAFDHLAKPVGREALRELLQRMLRREPPLPASPAPEPAEAGELIGVSDAMRELHKRIGLAAASAAPVLILGETGTGKEMVARAMHRHSARAQRPFLAVNCAAIPRELLESELFGHVRGAFTGATGDRPGCFCAADGGVLLLDEIGDMAPAVQAKILRVLQEGEVTPLGSSRALKVDVRIAAATHRDLAAAVREGAFREDLWYRLNVLSLSLPPLRQRLADIIPLAEHFLRLAARGATPKALSAPAAQALLRHNWPGNVRELRNLMERCQALLPHPVIAAADLAALQDGAAGGDDGALPPDWLDADLPTATARLERTLIARALARSEGNRAEAARRLGIHRQLLYRKLKEHGLG
jgi:two-component system NtrC family response regulator